VLRNHKENAVRQAPVYCPEGRANLLEAANRLTMQAGRAYAAGEMAQGAMCAWMSMYLHYRALGHSKRNSEMRVMVMERRDEL
jgi:hypothetical protein